MKLTKTKMKKISKKFRLFVFLMNVLVFVLFFFNLALLINGSWGDIRIPVVVVLPALSLVSLAVSFVNVSRYNSKGNELVASIAILGCTALLCFAVFIHPVVVALAGD